MMPPNWICEVLERRRAGENLDDQADGQYGTGPETVQANIRVKARVEQLSSGCCLYVPQSWKRRVSGRSCLKLGTASVHEFVK